MVCHLVRSSPYYFTFEKPIMDLDFITISLQFLQSSNLDPIKRQLDIFEVKDILHPVRSWASSHPFLGEMCSVPLRHSA